MTSPHVGQTDYTGMSCKLLSYGLQLWIGGYGALLTNREERGEQSLSALKFIRSQFSACAL